MATIERFATREEWYRRRHDGIGASEAAGILGRSRFSSPWSVWQLKVDRPEYEEREPNEMMEWGSRHEPAIAGKLEEVLRGEDIPWSAWQMHDPGDFTMYWADDPPWLFCTPDRLLTTSDLTPLADCELKGTWYEAAKEWRLALPLAYRIQCQVQMHCTEVDRCYYAVLLNGHEFRWFTEPRNDRFIKSMIRRLKRFWEEHVLTRSSPPVDYTDATSAAITDHYDAPDEAEAMLPSEFATQHENRIAWKKQVKDLQRKIRAIDNGLKSEIGSATVGVIPGVDGVYTWKPNRNGKRSLCFKAMTNGDGDDE